MASGITIFMCFEQTRWHNVIHPEQPCLRPLGQMSQIQPHSHCHSEKDNYQADALSFEALWHMSRQLKDIYLEPVYHWWAVPEVSLFASPHNTKCHHQLYSRAGSNSLSLGDDFLLTWPECDSVYSLLPSIVSGSFERGSAHH